MNIKAALPDIARTLVTKGKGILAADQSPRTMDKQLSAIGVTPDAEARRQYRELLFTTDGIEQYVTGIILHDGTIRNHTSNNEAFVDVLLAKGIIPIIKVDKSTIPHTNFPNEVVTQGLDGLAERFEEYYNMGARAAKWRSVFFITDTLPSEQNIVLDAMFLARYASLAQAAGIVPIVEPEVIFSGNHSLERAEEVTTAVLQKVFEVLQWYKVDLEGLILKSSMVLAGSEHSVQTPPEQVAEATIRTFTNSVPSAVPGIVFLSGGQTPERATTNLNAIAQLEQLRDDLPWEFTFSFSRGLELPVQEVWKGNPDNVSDAQAALIAQLVKNTEADQGRYQAE